MLRLPFRAECVLYPSLIVFNMVEGRQKVSLLNIEQTQFITICWFMILRELPSLMGRRIKRE